MKNLFLFFAVLFIGTFSTASAEWFVETVADYGQTPAISLDGSDLPRIAYGRYYKVKYSEYNGTTWTTHIIYNEYGYDCEYFDIVTDESGLSHVSFTQSSILYYSAEGASPDTWETDQLFPGTGGARWNSLGLSEQSFPGVSYHSMSANDLRYIFWDGSQWNYEFVDPEGNAGYNNSIVLEGENAAHIAYSTDSPTYGLKYAYRNGADDWIRSFVDSSMTSEPVGISIVLDGDGYPRISYNTSDELRYSAWNGSSWDTETVYSNDLMDTGANEYGTSLALFQNEYPHIVHCSLDADSLLYSWNDGTSWQTESIYPLGSTHFGDPDLAIDSQGRPHIAFFAGDLMYAYNDNALLVENNQLAIEQIEFNPLCNPFSEQLSLTFNLQQESFVELTVYDLQGREVSKLYSEFAPAGNTLVNWTPENSVPTGEYIVSLETRGTTISRKVVFLQ